MKQKTPNTDDLAKEANKVLKVFKNLPPERQQKALGKIAEIIASQNDVEIIELLRNYETILKSEVKTNG